MTTRVSQRFHIWKAFYHPHTIRVFDIVAVLLPDRALVNAVLCVREHYVS